MSSAKVAHTQNVAGNIVAHLPAAIGETLALVGHVDIAAPLAGRKLIVEADVIKTDGTGLLGADDKTAAPGVEVVMLGAGFYNPHCLVEYLDRAEFNELDSFVRRLIRG